MSIDRRQFERLKLSEDAVALTQDGKKLGKVSQAGGGGFLIFPATPEAGTQLGLLRLGYDDAARELVQRILAAVAREGLREYYNPRSGRGMGARDFAWSALASEFICSDPRARTSYID